MEIPIIRIGNSKGLRLSKTLIEKYNIRDKVKLVLEKEYMIIQPLHQPRKGWDEAFKVMSRHGEDQLLLDDVFEDENPEE